LVGCGRVSILSTLSRRRTSCFSKPQFPEECQTPGLYFERFRFTIIAHDKVRVFLFSIGNDILLVTAEPTISLNVAEKIVTILDKLD
jgi:hypothetical protein